MSSRQRLAGAVLLAGGLSIAAYGAWQLAILIVGLVRGVPAIAVGSAVFGVAPLGLCVAGFGLMLLAAGGSGAPRGGDLPRIGQLFAGTLLAGSLAIALLAGGPWMLGSLMKAGGYRQCDQQVGIRTAFGHWALASAACDEPVAGRSVPATNFTNRRSGS